MCTSSTCSHLQLVCDVFANSNYTFAGERGIRPRDVAGEGVKGRSVKMVNLIVRC